MIASLGLMSLANADEGINKMDQKSAVVRMNVGRYAKITNLNDFVLYTKSESGSANALYEGSDKFNLESNCAVQVDLEGEKLTNGTYSLATKYNLDGKESISTDRGVHSQEHSVGAQALLGNISSQEAGDYKANITLTVSAID